MRLKDLSENLNDFKIGNRFFNIVAKSEIVSIKGFTIH